MASTSGVHVSCRLRGLAPHDDADDGVEVVKCAETDNVWTSGTVAVHTASTSHAFQFDRVFQSSATQQDVYECIGRPCVEDLMLGYHCTILAYGQTGSGKTHTTIGPDNSIENQGLVPRLLEQLFLILEQEEHRDQVTLSASFVEVYQERLRDLLIPIGRTSSSSSSQLRIREDKGSGSVWVDGATDIALPDLKTARAVVQRGLSQRVVGATRMNEGSSRSHAVFALTMTKNAPATDVSKGPTRARLCVVDLAGSEQAKRTKASGTRLDEAKHINKSLSALGNVIHALTASVSGSSPPTTAAYVPYRDSKLTRLLQTSLGGNAKTYLLLTCASAACHVEESLSTLRFGARAKQMQNKPTVNRPLTSPTASTRSSQAAELLETLQRKIESLCRYIHELEYAAARGPECCARCGSLSEANSQPTDEPAVECDDEGTIKCEDVEHLTGTSSDVIMQAELLVLRKALVDMQRLQEHELSHALSLEQSVVQAEGVALLQLHERLAQDVERLDCQLDDAEAQIATLQQQLRQSHANEQELQGKLRQCEAFAKREEAARDAEVEILRRRVEMLERQAKPLQVELLASRQEALELRHKAEQSESEWRRLREENDALKKRIHALQMDVAVAAAVPVAAVVSSSPPSSLRKPLLRPMTVALDGSGSPVHSNAIQSWWTGNNSEEDDDETSIDKLRRTGATPSRTDPSSSGLAQCSRQGAVDPRGGRSCVSRERPQLHTSGGSRPFRARLVGLLTSLEEETSSYKELLQVATEEPTGSGISGGAATGAARSRPPASRTTRKHRLPELERSFPSADEEREKR